MQSKPTSGAKKGAGRDTLRPSASAEYKEKLELFCREYIVDFDGERAAVASGFKATRADALLKDQRVLDFIERLKVSRSYCLDLKAEDVVRELQLLGFSNMLDYLKPNVDGDLRLDFRNLSRIQASAIAQYEQGPLGVTKFKLHDKIRPLELLAKHLGMFNERFQLQDANGNIVVNIGFVKAETSEAND